ncbi:siderophore ABC transporter substrate-binding protein [Cytobacillus sp. FJAT-54145]|uniref:Siderophore ABC transporter substrate-binding protein n=1 Tax=Cytobacillus spartinae TaxID=3299023 RepID=A0ABW6KAY1_9BACI
MKKNLLLTLFTAMLVMFLAACGSDNTEEASNERAETKTESEQAAAEPEELTIKHDLGEAVVQKNPETVVVFDFGALDILDKLGVEVDGVPQGGTFPKYLSKFAGEEYENVGSLKEPDFEAIYGMEPDLILISGRQSAAYEELNKIAPTVFVGVDNAKYMESFTHNVNTLAEIFGKEAEAETELAKINEAIDSLKAVTAADDKKGLVTLTTGGKLSAYGPGSRFGILHDVFGVKPADENIEASTHGMSVTFEYIAETNPDYLFVVDRDAVVEGNGTAADMFDNELVNKTNAAKNGKIIYLDPALWYIAGGGLTSVAQQVAEIEAALK